MNFCFDRNIRFAIVPAEMHNGNINSKFRNNKEYQNLIKEIISAKERNKLVFNTRGYLERILTFEPFTCFPLVTPHVYPNGDLLCPCQPLQKEKVNLIKEGSYKKALEKVTDKIPKCSNRCYKSCYIEPSMFLQKPSLILKEYL